MFSKRNVIVAIFTFFFLIPHGVFALTTTFTALDDNDWNNPLNWDNGIPSPSDTAIINGAVADNTGGAITITTLQAINVAEVGVNLTVTGTAEFSGNSTLTALLTGNASFTGNAINYDEIIGDVTFDDDSVNEGNVSGTATFRTNGYSTTNSEVEYGIFYDSSYIQGSVGNATFYNSAILGDSAIVTGNATFNDDSYSNGLIMGDATYYDNSYNFQGTVQGNAEFWDTTLNDTGATVEGNACFAATATNSGTVLGSVSVCDSTPPSVTNISVSSITKNSVVISWTTSENATSTASFGLTTSYGNTATSTGTTSHTVSLTGLDPGRRYHYKISARDALNNLTVTSDAVFDTLSSVRSGSRIKKDENKIINNVKSINQTDVRFLFTKDFKLGDLDFEVLKLQQYLNKIGFLVAESGPGSKGYETERFGRLTFMALKRFQASVGLPATGFFGPKTKKYINFMSLLNE